MMENNKDEIARLQALLLKHGVCEKCGEMYSHHLAKPFASCNCSTSEWINPTPYMDLEQKLMDESFRNQELRLLQKMERKSSQKNKNSTSTKDCTEKEVKMLIKKINSTAIIPTRGSEHAAGLDLYADETIYIPAHSHKIVPTGVAIAVPTGCVGLIWPRSGLSATIGVDVLAGVIDSDYRGEIKVVLQSHYNALSINKGERIAQLLIQKIEMVEVTEVENLPSSDRGESGFGSTGN